jgi:hypothetical protein
MLIGDAPYDDPTQEERPGMWLHGVDAERYRPSGRRPKDLG